MSGPILDERTVAITRVFDAPRERVFAAWTQARHLARWFGPQGFSAHSCRADPRPGGVFELCMRSPRGEDYWVRGTYREVRAPERLVIECSADDEKGRRALDEVIEASFAERSGRTTLTLRAHAVGRGERAAPMLKGMDQGWKQTIDRLQSHVTKGAEMQVQPYLFFEGRCEEALEFYKKAIGAKVEMLMRYQDSPEPPPPGMKRPPADKVMHASFRVGESAVNASDGNVSGKPSFQGISLTLYAKDEPEAKRLYGALAEGGQAHMPIAKTFFSPAFGMLADRFGVNWMVIVAPQA